MLFIFGRKRKTPHIATSKMSDFQKRQQPEHPKPVTQDEYEKRSLAGQIEYTKEALQPNSDIYWGLCEVVCLIEMFFKHIECHYMKENQD